MAALQAGLLLVAMFANAAPQKDTVRITVLDSVTRASSLDDNNGVPTNCEQVTFDAYCRSTTNVPLVSTLLVQEGDNPPFRISCKVESRYSRCTPLPKGATFDARREKHGITVYYVDDKGKARSQLYKLVAPDAKANATTAAATPSAPIPQTAAAPQNSPPPAPVVPAAAAPRQSSPAPAQVPPSVSAQGVLAKKVKCNFSSTPPGAEITIDWRYVGSTPSEISLSIGTHIVVISAPGFAEWKRELTVVADSAVNVTASLQKAQP
jgi:hypothetical protein